MADNIQFEESLDDIQTSGSGDNNPDTKKKGGGIRRLIIIALIIIILVIGFVMYYLLFVYTEEEVPEGATMYNAQVSINNMITGIRTGSSDDAPTEVTYGMESLVINLAGDSVGYMVKLEMVLVYHDEKRGYDPTTFIPENEHKIKDAIIVYMRTRDVNDLIEIGILSELKEDLKNEINNVIGDELIEDIYFVDYLIG